MRPQLSPLDFSRAPSCEGLELNRAGSRRMAGGLRTEIGSGRTWGRRSLRQNRLDGLWNNDFQTRNRAAILRESANGDNFEWTVRKAVDCRLGGVFTVNYVTSYDVEGNPPLPQ
jgi:hypothetical protein